MNIHLRIVLRQCLKEIDVSLDIRENLDSRLNHRRDLLQIQILGDYFLDVRLCHLIELIKIHRLDVLAVHPFQFYHIENSRRFADILVVELFYQLV